MKKVLVTGGTGFLGKPCLPLLLASGYEVHVVTSQSKNDLKTLKLTKNLTNVNFHQVDLLSGEENINNLVAEVQPTHLLHLAWCRTLPGIYGNHADNLRWVEASLTLFRKFECFGGRRIVVAGTCMEYDWTYGFCSEAKTPLRPNSVYGTCKQSLQLLLSAFAEKTGISTAWGRVFFLYGPHEYETRLVASVIRSLLKDETALCSNGEQFRDFLHIDDAANAFVKLLESDISGPVNIGSGQPVRVKDVAHAIGNLLQRPELIQLGGLPERLNEPPLLVADVRRLVSIGWERSYVLEHGIYRTIDWWRNNEKF